MKKILALAAFTLIATLYFTSCDLDSENYTPRERMEAFIEDANAGRWLDLKQHTHPGATQYNGMTTEIWKQYFKEGIVSLTISGTTATFTSESVDYPATLMLDGEDNYKIRRIERTSPPTSIFFQ